MMAIDTVAAANAAPASQNVGFKFDGNDVASAVYDLVAVAHSLEWHLHAMEEGEVEDPRDQAHQARRVSRFLRVALDELATSLADCTLHVNHQSDAALLARVLRVTAPAA